MCPCKSNLKLKIHNAFINREDPNLHAMVINNRISLQVAKAC